jgi:hypothetical protein
MPQSLFFHPPTPPVGGHYEFSKERFLKERPRPGKSCTIWFNLSQICVDLSIIVQTDCFQPHRLHFSLTS